MQEDLYWLGFSEFPGIGPARFHALLDTFDTAKAAWEARSEELEKVLGKALTGKFSSFRITFSLSGYARTLERRKINYLLVKNDNYPKLLEALSNAPFVLYVKGDVDLVSRLGDEPHPDPLLRGEKRKREDHCCCRYEKGYPIR